jgi:hypothetical protein
MRRTAGIAAVVAVGVIAGVAMAQPVDPGGGLGSGSGSGLGSGSGSGSGSGLGSGSGSGSGSGARKKIVIDIPPDVVAPKVAAAASPSEVLLGNRLTLFITVTFDPSETVNLVQPLDLGPAFEAVRQGSTDRTTTDGQKIREYQIQLIVWEVGDLVIPQLPVTFTYQGKALQTATNEVPIRSNGSLGGIVDDPAARPLARPAVLLSRDWFLIILAASVVGVVIGVLVATKVRIKRKRRVLGAAYPLVRRLPRKLEPAAEEALRRLTELEQSGRLEDPAERTAGYRELADIMRTYIGRRGGFVVTDRTTYEIMERLRDKPIIALADLLDDLERWFRDCDLVKFAAYEATADEAQTALARARELVLASVALPAAAGPIAMPARKAEPDDPPPDDTPPDEAAPTERVARVAPEDSASEVARG